MKLIDYGITYYDFNNEKLRLIENIKNMNYDYLFLELLKYDINYDNYFKI